MDASVAPTARAGARTVPGRLQTIVVLAVTAILIGAAAWFLESQAAGDGVTEVQIEGNAGAVRVGDVPPAFTATTIDGAEVALADYAGRPLWLVFGASWCADCRAEAPDLQAAWQRYRGEGLGMLAVNIQEDAQAAKAYADRAGLTYPTVADPRTAIASRFGIYGIPTHYFIGSDGRVREIRVGALQPADIDALLAGILP